MSKNDVFHVILFLVAFVIVCIGCCFLFDKLDSPPESDLQSLQSEYVYDYVDPDTGVHYLLYAIGAKGGICVRYNSDGSVMVED